MAEKKFGVREINVINPTGTPTIESTGDLNINAGSGFDVNINTDLGVSGVVTATDANVTGVVTATSFSGSGANLTNVVNQISAGTGISVNNSTGNVTITASGGGTADITEYISEWTLGANVTSDYTFSGNGLTGAENDPTLYLVRGQKYKFTNSMGAHPFRIQSTPNGSTGTQYNDGITNNDVSNGTLTWNVQFDAPDVLYYQCTAHPDMGGIIYIGNGLRNLPQVSKTSAYTLIATDTGKHISITTGGVTVASGVFSIGDIVTIFNNSSSSQTITQGSSVTLRQAGTSNTGNRSLAQYGTATLMCVASNVFVISGSGLS